MFASRFLIQGNNWKVQSLSYCELRGTALDLAHAVISLRGHSPPRNTGVHAPPTTPRHQKPACARAGSMRS